MQWNLHKTDTIGEPTFGCYSEVVFVEVSHSSNPAENESWSFVSSSYNLCNNFLLILGVAICYERLFSIDKADQRYTE